MDLTLLDPAMFDSIHTGLLWFVAVFATGGSAIGAVAAVNARA